MSTRSWLWSLVFLPFSFIHCLAKSLHSSSSSKSSPNYSFLPLSSPPMPPAQVLLINLILLTNHLNLPSSATIFLPLNHSIAVAFPSSHDLDRVAYHIVTSRYTFKDLLLINKGDLQTLLLGRSVRINNSGMNVLADEHEIVAPDLYSDENIVIHGISRALDPDFFYMSRSSDASKISPIPGLDFFSKLNANMKLYM